MAFGSPRISSRVLQCLEPLQGESKEEKEIQAIDAANRGDFRSFQGLCLLCESLGAGLSRDLIIVYSESFRPPEGRSAE